MADAITKYVLDACALIAYFREEEGGDKLWTALKESDKKFFIHAINLPPFLR